MQATLPINKMSQPYFTSISVNGKTVVTTDYSREDRMDLAGRKSLKKIHIHNISGGIVKTFGLEQSYFETPQIMKSNVSELNYRLKLDQVRVYDNSESDYLPYTFTYMEGGLPPRDSAAQDYWGYYNGSGGEYMTAGNTIVRQDMQTYSVNGYKNGGTNRNPDLYFLKIGTLNKITYPTGGSTEYFYQMPTKIYTQTENITPTVSRNFQGGLIPATSQEIADYYRDDQALEFDSSEA